MKEREIHITNFDYQRLKELMKFAKEFKYQDRNDLKKLENELARATIVDSRDVPPNVVTMNCKVELLDLNKNKKMTYTLVFPSEADISQGKISILCLLYTSPSPRD